MESVSRCEVNHSLKLDTGMLVSLLQVCGYRVRYLCSFGLNFEFISLILV